jgi:hypothetical protein
MSVLTFKIATISIYIYLNGVPFMVWIYKKTVYVYFLLDTIIPLFYQATYVFLSHVMTLTSM